MQALGEFEIPQSAPPQSWMPTPAQYTAVGLSAANLVPVIMWLSKWPLQPLNEAQAGAIAGLLLAAGGLIHAIIQSYQSDRQ